MDVKIPQLRQFALALRLVMGQDQQPINVTAHNHVRCRKGVTSAIIKINNKHKYNAHTVDKRSKTLCVGVD